MRGNAHTLLFGRTRGQTLNPISLNHTGADAASLPPGFSRRAGLVCGEKLFPELGIKALAVCDVRTEPAAGKNHGFASADALHPAAFGVPELIVLMDLNARDAAGIGPENFLHENTGTDFGAKLFEFGNSRNDDPLASPLLGDHAARGRVAALAGQVFVPFNADVVPRPLKGVRSLFADKADVVGIT